MSGSLALEAVEVAAACIFLKRKCPQSFISGLPPIARRKETLIG